MKIKFTVIITAVLMLCLGVSSGAADLREGFMRYKWGENILQYEGMERLYSKKDVIFYRNPGESYAIEDISIDDVIFGAYKGKLFAVYIAIDTLEKYDVIDRYLRKKYGLPATKVYTEKYLTTYKWEYQDVTIKLKTDEVKDKMKVAFYYEKLSRDLNKVTVDDIDKSSYRFFPIDKNKKPEMIPFLAF